MLIRTFVTNDLKLYSVNICLNYSERLIRKKYFLKIVFGKLLFFLSACNESRIEGSNNNDNLVGTSDSDILLGFEGEDTFKAGTGNDIFDGGEDIDTVNYSDVSSSINVNLSLESEQATVGVYTDTLINIENIIGSSFNDIIKDSQADNKFTGGFGDDTFEITAGYNTIMDLHTGDIITVGEGATINALVDREFIATSETINYGTFKLVASNNGAQIDMSSTLAGDYILIGGSGNDLLVGGPQDDILTGGEGSDTFVVNAGNDYISDLSSGDALQVSSDSTVTAFNIVNFVANDLTESFGSVTLIAQKEGAVIDLRLAKAGEYVLVGNSGDDSLTGGPGNDILTGDSSSVEAFTEKFSALVFDNGNDIFNISSGVDLISDLSSGDNFVVSSGATVNATNISNFIATSSTSNSGTANLTAGNSGS
ncbi:MAG: calcium-binding protein, partial [Paracoccaceae bacterium]|nr:calcium-binding protein [Paracoccaceae bacterium]